MLDRKLIAKTKGSVDAAIAAAEDPKAKQRLKGRKARLENAIKAAEKRQKKLAAKEASAYKASRSKLRGLERQLKRARERGDSASASALAAQVKAEKAKLEDLRPRKTIPAPMSVAEPAPEPPDYGMSYPED